jgi:electron transfer flavoprotein alpha subunit
MTAQLMTIGTKLAGMLKKTVDLVFLGDESLTGVESGYQIGAQRVYAATDAHLGQYMAEPYLQALQKASDLLKPSVILFGHNDKGLELAPRLAFRLNTGVVLDCVDIKTNDSGDIEYIKPVYGGKAHAHFAMTGTGPQIVSIREGAFGPASDKLAAPNDTDRSEVLPLELKIDTKRIKTIFHKKEIDDSIALALKLARSKIVVCGGRGLKSAEGIEVIKETADLLDGAIAGSRPAIDYGWLSSTLQVGLTGKKVNPQLYFAVGVSGALQHMAGCMKSKTIVAINTDESAQIFKFSHIGVVGNYQEVLKGFNDEVRIIKQQKG